MESHLEQTAAAFRTPDWEIGSETIDELVRPMSLEEVLAHAPPTSRARMTAVEFLEKGWVTRAQFNKFKQRVKAEL